MSYQIAIGSSDGLNIDLKFGEADHFLIYKVDGKKYELYESRTVKRADDEKVHEKEDHCEEKGCSTKGCSGNGHGCGGASAVTDKVERIADVSFVQRLVFRRRSNLREKQSPYSMWNAASRRHWKR